MTLTSELRWHAKYYTTHPLLASTGMRSIDGRKDGGGSPDPPVAPGAFLDGFEVLTQAIRRARGTSVQDVAGRLSLSQYALVRALAARDSARVSDLAGDADISPSTATRILDALERRSIVHRRRTPEDGRGVTVSLTEDGRAALARQDDWMRSRLLAFYEELPAAERDAAARLLVGMARLIDELAAGPTD